jgi:O-antigen ligase
MSHGLLALIAVPVVLFLLVVCIREPMRIALPLFAALVPFGGGLSVGPSRYGSLSSLIGFVLGVGLVMQLVSARRGARRVSPTVPVWLLFLGVAGASVLWSITPSTSISDFLILASLILVFVFVSLSQVDRVVLRRTENGLLAGASAAAIYGFTQLIFLGGLPSDVPGVGASPEGRFGNGLLGPDNQAVAMLLPLSIALNRMMTMADRRKRVFHGLIASLLLGAILLTGSRGGLLATVVVIVTLAFTMPRGKRSKLLAYGAIGVIVAALVWIYHPAGIANRTFTSVTSSSGRTSIWQVGLAACPQYCPFGSGWGTFPDVYAATQATVPGASVLTGTGGSYQPHNLWLLAAIELGLPGLLLMAAGLGLALLEALRLPASLRRAPLSALVGTIVAAMFLSNLEFKFFWMALIAVALAHNLADADPEFAGSGRAGSTGSGGAGPAPPDYSGGDLVSVGPGHASDDRAGPAGSEGSPTLASRVAHPPVLGSPIQMSAPIASPDASVTPTATETTRRDLRESAAGTPDQSARRFGKAQRVVLVVSALFVLADVIIILLLR